MVSLASNLYVDGLIRALSILIKTGNTSFVIANSVNQTIAEFYENKTAYFQSDITVNGNISARNLNPYYCAGKFNGTDLTKISTLGRQGFYLSRAYGYSVGVYYIEFVNALSNADYIITLTNESKSRCKVWDVIRPSTSGFYIISFNGLEQFENTIVHFTVFAGY